MNSYDKLNLICGNESPNIIGFDFSNTPDLLFYSYIPIAILVITFSILVKSHNKKDVLSESLLSFFISFLLWIVNILVQWTSSIHFVILLSWKLTIFFEVLLYLYSFQLSYLIIFKKKLSSLLKRFVVIVTLICIPLKYNIYSYNIERCEGVLGSIWDFVYTIEPLTILGIFIAGILMYLRKDRLNKDKEGFILNLGIVTFLTIFYLSNIYSELKHEYEFNFYGPVGMIFLIILFSYSIIKYNTFKISRFSSKILIACLVISITSLFLIRSIGILNVITPITFLTILIFSALLTLTIQSSYDLEMKAHRELKKLTDTKDQFITLAQHNLRVPISNISNNLKDILNGRYGHINNETRSAIEDTIRSSDNLKHIADDFKDITKMKLGSQILNISNVDTHKLMNEVINDLKLDIKNMSITLSYPTDKNSWSEIRGDYGKIKDVFIVIIENAIKYNITNGNINISTNKKPMGFEIEISNTGVGMTNEERENVLSKSFYRSKRVQEINPTGMGIGLYISKSIIESHHGKIDITSLGQNKGAKVTVYLPYDFLNNLDI